MLLVEADFQMNELRLNISRKAIFWLRVDVLLLLTEFQPNLMLVGVVLICG